MIANHKVVPVKTYVTVFGTLMLLTFLTVAAAHVNIAHHLPVGGGNVANDFVAMAIALTKATIVVLFFMHVKGSTRMIQVTIVSALLFLAILFGYTLFDYVTRGWLGVPGR